MSADGLPTFRARPSRARPLTARLASAALLGFAAWATFGGAAAAQGAPASLPSFTADQSKRGAQLYVDNCALCHGDALDDGQFAPPLKGQPHAAYWQGKSAGDLLSYMASAMPPTQPGGLGAQAYADIMAYLYEKQGVAPGSTELPADPAKLSGAKPTP